MILPTYKFGDDGRCFTMVSTTNTSSCQPLLFSTFQWHTADQIDFFFHVIFLCFWFLPQRCIRHLHKSLWLSAQKSYPAAAAAAPTAAAAAAAAVDLDQAADL